SYTAGVNAYINSLSEGNMPVEYKLLDYKPEQWNNLKIALFIKLMSSDLAGQQYARDIEFTNEKAIYSEAEMNILYPQISDSLIPIIPKGTTFNQPTLTPTPPPGVDSIYFKKDTVVRTPEAPKITDFKGSNSWAVSGSRTRSGNPIIANDPHLRLTFPSIWYEMQITTPTMNVYGVTFPSIPGIVVGFNDHIAWGFTNAGRDIIDYYQVRFKDDSKKEYWFNGNWQPTQLKIETIHIKGRAPYYDTVAYTAFGPVMYDNNFTTGDTTNKTALAVRWIAHDSSNEQMMWIKINRAKNYSNFMEAVKHFSAPAQNIIIASKTGDIAIWQQGKFPARWPGQGLYIMPGEDSSYMWQGYIPNEENPQVLNPAQGFIQSANQRAVDSTYPYFIPGDYFDPRAIAIHNELLQMNSVVPQDMMALQLNNFSTLAEDAVPLLLKYTDVASLPGKKEQEYLKEIKNWDFNLTTDSKAATIFQTWLDSLQVVIFKDEFSQINQPITLPEEQTLIEILIRDSTFRFIDNINTEEKETIQQQITAAFKLAVNDLNKEEARTGLMWGKHKNTSILHLLRESVLPFGKTGLNLPGWRTTINAITKTNGPSWRMVVHLSPETEAYGVYPGGQSGNPG
ncbi:MAG TPA: penicillin acylase family protein, partial [Flavisolibacter sp.]|nr:penicillin acylase family protein [Flavisolibacter sp.]